MCVRKKMMYEKTNTNVTTLVSRKLCDKNGIKMSLSCLNLTKLTCPAHIRRDIGHQMLKI